MDTSHENSDDRANSPALASAGGWWAITRQTWREGADDSLGLLASGIAFNAFLAMVPTLTVAVLAYGLVTSQEQVARHIAYLAQILPQDAANLIGNQLQSMVDTSQADTWIGLVIALTVAIYGALRGATGLVVALNLAYDVQEERSFLLQTAISLALTLGGVLALVIGSVGVSAMALLASVLPHMGGATLVVVKIGFWLLAALALSLMLAAAYAWGPNRPSVRWRWFTPGSTVATLLWIATTVVFSFYVSNFANYNATYGALGAVIVLLTWLYLSGYIVLLGAELNQVLARRRPSAAGD